MGHFGFKGCITPDGGIEPDEIVPSDFSVPTILGHIHTPFEVGKVTVLGTPYSTNFSETHFGHRYAIINEDWTIDTFPIKTKLNHLNIDDGQLDNLDDFELEEDALNLVYFWSTKDSNIKEVRKKLKSISDFIIVKTKNVNNKFSKHWDGNIEDLPLYVDDCKTELDKEKLVEVVKGLIGEVNENKDDTSE